MNPISVPGFRSNVSILSGRRKIPDYALLSAYCITVLLVLVTNGYVFGWEIYLNRIYFFLSATLVLLLFFVMLYLQHSIPGQVKNRVNLHFSYTRIDILFSSLVLYILFQDIARMLLQKKLDWLTDQSFILLWLLGLYFVSKYIIRVVPRVVFVYFFCGLALLTSIVSLLQYTHWIKPVNSQFPLTGFFNNPGPLAIYLAAAFPFSLSILKLKSPSFLVNSNRKIFAYTSIGLSLVTIILSGSRLGLAGIGISIFLFLKWEHLAWDNLKIIHKRYRVQTTLFYLFVLCVCLLLFYWKSASSIGRILIWQVCGELWRTHWFEGIGYGRLGVEYANHQSLYFSSHPGSDSIFSQIADMNYFAFNEWIQIGVETGFPGFFLFLLMCITALRSRLLVLSFNPAKVSLIVIVSAAMFSYPLQVLSIHLLFVFCLSSVSTEALATKKISFQLLGWKSYLLFFLTGITCIVLVFTEKQVLSRYQTICQWRQAYTVSLFSKLQALPLYDQLAFKMQSNGEFLFNYGALLYQGHDYATSIAVLEKAKQKFNHIDLYLFLGNSYKECGQLKKAEENYIHACHMIPSRFYPKHLLLVLYTQSKQIEKAKVVANDILTMKEKIPSPTVTAIKQNAFQVLKK